MRNRNNININKTSCPPFKMGAIAGLLLLATLGSSNAYAQIMPYYAEPLTYDGSLRTGTSRLGTLGTSSDFGIALGSGAYYVGVPPTLGLNTTDVGIVYMGATLDWTTNEKIPGTDYRPITNGANLTIDYSPSTGTVPKFVIGGYAQGSKSSVSGVGISWHTVSYTVADNKIQVNQGRVDGPVFSALVNNTFIEDDATSTTTGSDTSVKTGFVMNHYNPTASLTMTGNTLTVDGSQSIISGNATAGQSYTWAQSGNATASNASSSGSADASANATSSISLSGTAMLNVDNNSITLTNNAFVGGSVYAASNFVHLQTGNAIAGNADASLGTGQNFANADSSITLTQGLFKANNNTISIQKATVGQSIYGSYIEFTAHSGDAAAGTVDSGANNVATSAIDVSGLLLWANQNTVEMNGTLQSGSIYGGYVKLDLVAGNATGGSSQDSSITLTGNSITSTGNTVTIGENAKVNSNSTSLYGGFLEYTSGPPLTMFDFFTGNTLNFSAHPITVDKVANFETYNFGIHPSYANKTQAFINANEIVLAGNSDNMSLGNAADHHSGVNVTGIHSGNVLKEGDLFYLMKASSGITGNANGKTEYVTQVQQGISLLYNVKTTVDVPNDFATAEILSCEVLGGGDCPVSDSAAKINPQLKALSEGHMAGLQMLTRGADIAAYEVFNAINEQNAHKGLTPFIVISGQHNRYNSGSHIKSNDLLLTGGLSYQEDALAGAVFLEAGRGSYDTYNSFAGVGNVKGDGRNDYFGLGVYGRYELVDNAYVDASARFGQNRNKFDTGDILHSITGENAKYKIRSNYVSAHIGGGYIFEITEKNSLDVSAKYLWTQLNGKDMLIARDPIHFDRVKSQRLRADATLNHQYSSALTLRAGLGYEHEYSAESQVTAYNDYDVEAPSLKGGTGIVSIGATTKPASNQNLSLNFGLSGYAGKREGVGATFRINYAF